MDFFDTLKHKYGIGLSEQQKSAATHVSGPALILAGPGSGKTTVITSRVAYLIMHVGVAPENILTLTFNKAAQLEMNGRFTALFGDEIAERVHFSTLHSFCNRVVIDYERMKNQRLKRIEGNDQLNKKHILRELYYKITNSKINDDELENLINDIGYVKNTMQKNIEEVSSGLKNFQQIYKAYEEYKKNNLMIDFDDMLTYAYTILARFPKILNYYRSRFKYIQVDEGQDLSKIQFEIIKLLTDKVDNLFIVADDDQSIYGFRGAAPDYIINIGRQLSGCSVYRLENNYRSTSNIVELSSNFIKKNKNRLEKQHVTENAALSEPIIIDARDEYEQLAFIISRLKEYENKEIAILYRNNLSSILIADALSRRGIIFKIKQNKLFFFNHWLVQEVIAFLAFALDQSDIEAFAKIYYKMNRFISKAMLEGALKEAGKNVIDSIINNADLKPYQINTLTELKTEFAGLTKLSPWNALEYIKNDFRYLDSIKGYCELTGMSYEYMNKLFGIMQEIASGCQTIVSFMARLNELDDLFEGVNSDKKPNKSIKVTLSTFHSAKGLEYDCVFMYDLVNSEIPGEKALDSEEPSMLEEERRLFYVGMTRARHELYLLYPKLINNTTVPRTIFVNEVVYLLQKEILDGVGEGSIVRHKKFGRGVVVALELGSYGQQTIEIKFFSGLQKTLDYKICMDNELLEFE